MLLTLSSDFTTFACVVELLVTGSSGKKLLCWLAIAIDSIETRWMVDNGFFTDDFRRAAV